MTSVMKRFWMSTGMTVVLAVTCSAAPAQYGQNTNNQNRDENKNGQNVGQNRNDQNRQNHDKFDQHDQQVTRDWYSQHHNNAPVGLRDRDRLAPDEESRLQPGATLDSRLRAKTHPLPPDLSRELPPPPHNSRYVAVGGHVAQVDNRNRVQDVIHLELNVR